jgi:acyl carrier protein
MKNEMETTAADVEQFILGRIGDPLQAKGMAPAEVPGSFDLLLEGVIDSFGIVELISALEERYGLEFEFDELAPDDLTRIGPLSSYVAQKLNGR